MIVKVRLYAVLKDRLPPGTKGEEMELDLPEGTTPKQVIERLEIPPPLAHLVMLDGYHLLPDEVRNRPILKGEVLSIFPPVAGG